jgi:hypothetical protein
MLSFLPLTLEQESCGKACGKLLEDQIGGIEEAFKGMGTFPMSAAIV